MKQLASPFGILGLFYLILGLVLNIKMYLNQTYPTYMYVILMGIGLTMILTNELTKKIPYYIWQLIVGVLPIIGFYLFIY